MIIEMLATVFGIVMSVAAIPQTYKIFKRKSASDVSIMTFGMYFVGSVVWMIYGFSIGNTPIKISYTIGSLSSLSVIVGWMIHR